MSVSLRLATTSRVSLGSFLCVRPLGDSDTVRRRWNRNYLAVKAFLIDPLSMRRTFEPLRLLGTHSFFFLIHGMLNELIQDVAAKIEGPVTLPPILSSREVFTLCNGSRPSPYSPSLPSPLPVLKGKRRKDHRSPRVGYSKSWSGLRMYAILDSMQDSRRKLRDELDGKPKGKRRIAYI